MPFATFAKLLPISHVLLDLDVSSKKRLFEQIGLLFENENKISRAAVFDALFAREKLGSTGLGHGVAIPHTKTTTVQSPLAAIGISRTGVDFNALDKQPVYSIVLMLSPEDQPALHTDAMKAIFTHLSKDQFRRFLRQATTVDAVTTLLDEADAGPASR